MIVSTYKNLQIFFLTVQIRALDSIMNFQEYSSEIRNEKNSYQSDQ